MIIHEPKTCKIASISKSDLYDAINEYIKLESDHVLDLPREDFRPAKYLSTESEFWYTFPVRKVEL